MSAANTTGSAQHVRAMLLLGRRRGRALVAGSNEDVIRAVLKAWGEGVPAAQEATRKHFAEDCVWEQPGLPTTHSAEEAAVSLVHLTQMGFSGIEVEYRNVVAAGDIVFTERRDAVVRPDGSRMGPFPVVGVVEFHDGKISAWREYFDSAIVGQLEATRPPD